MASRTDETREETYARYLDRYGAATLRAMAAEWRLHARHGGARLPLRYAVAADAVASLTVIGAM